MWLSSHICLIRNKIKRTRQNMLHKTIKHRASWQAALHRCSIYKLSYTKFVFSNIYSLLSNILAWKPLVQTSEYCNCGLLLDPDSSLKELDAFQSFHLNRSCSYNNRFGWVQMMSKYNCFVFYSTVKITYISIQCRPKILQEKQFNHMGWLLNCPNM